MWWKLGALGLVVVVIVALLVMPISTVEITVEMPRSPSTGRPQVIDEGEIEAIATAVTAIIALAAAGLVAWIAHRIVRHHRPKMPPS